LDIWNNEIKSHTLSLHIIHINIRSLRKNFNELQLLLSGCIDRIDIIALTEVNIREQELPLYKLENYDTHVMTRETSRGGGILVYVRKKFNFAATIIKSNYSEILHGDLLEDGKKLAHLFVVYRPPKTNKHGFVTDIHRLLSSIPTGQDLIVIGDTNIDLLNEVGSGSVINLYRNNMCELGLECAINDVTREEVYGGQVTRTCIDHAWVRTQRAVSSYVLTTKVSDHYPIGVNLSIVDHAPIGKRTPVIILCEKTVETLFESVNWEELTQLECPLQLYDSLCSVFSSVYSDSKIRITPRVKRKDKTWINKRIKKMLLMRDKLFKKWKSSPNDMNLRLQYNKYRNRVNKCINKAKNKSRQEELKQCKNNSRKIWEKINLWTGTEKLSIDSIIQKHLGKNDSIINICNKFSQTFTQEIL
jgi:hypothetical protein